MKKVIFALAICATIVSCQKKEDTDPIDVSKTTYLMNESWQLKEFTYLNNVSDSAAFPIDSFTSQSGCVKDNYFKFNTTSRCSLYEGLSKCNTQAPDSTVYGYQLTNNDAHLFIFTDPDLPNHNSVLNGDVKYPSIDTFVVTYRQPRQDDSNIIAEYVKTYVKIH